MGKKWATVPVTGYKSLTIPDDGTAVESNRVKYATITTDLTDPLNVATLAAIANLDQVFTETTVAKSAPYTTVASDHSTWLEVTGTTTITLILAATGGAGYHVGIKNAGTALVTVDGNGAELIGGAATVTLQPGFSGIYVVDAAGTGWIEVGNTPSLPSVTSCKAILSATQTGIVETTPTAVAFNQTAWDTGSNFNTGGNYFDVPVTGKYLVFGGVNWTTNKLVTPSPSHLYVYKNPLGAGAYDNALTLSSHRIGATGSINDSFGGGIIDVTATDRLKLYARGDDFDGDNTGEIAASANSSFLIVTRVS